MISVYEQEGELNLISWIANVEPADSYYLEQSGKFAIIVDKKTHAFRMKKLGMIDRGVELDVEKIPSRYNLYMVTIKHLK
jgi:hypothetical protein